MNGSPFLLTIHGLRKSFITFYGVITRGHFSIPKQRMLFPELIREEHPLVRPLS